MKLKSIILFFAILCSLQIAVFSQTNDVLIAKAKSAIEKNDYVSAMSSLSIIFKRSPNDEAAFTQRARIYVKQSKFAEAMADATKVLAKNPNNYEALNVRGIIKRDRDKDFKGALDDFTQVVTIKPDFYIGYINLGVTNRSLKKANEANKAFSKAIELAPNNPIGFAYRGSNWSALSRYKEAILDYDKAISLNDKSESYYANRGYCHFRMFIESNVKSSFDLAKSDVEKSINLNPNNSLAFGIRSVIRVEENNLAGATADADKSLQLNPNSYLSYITKGFIKFSSDRDGALEEFEKALKLAPNDQWVKSKRDAAVRNSPTAQAKFVELAKQKVAANLWNFTAYDELNDAFSSSRLDWKIVRTYWENMVSQNPKNICAIRFLGEYKGGNFYMDLVNFLDDGLRLYDGKNGAECAANIAQRIAREYDSRQSYDLAKTYYDKARTIKSDLSGLDSNVAEIERIIDRNKAEDERLTTRLAELDKTKTPSRGSDTGAFSDKEFDEASAALERDTAANNRHIAKYNEYATVVQKNPSYTANYPLMLKEAEEIIANKERFLNKYSGILTASGNMSLVFDIRFEIKEWKVRAKETKKLMK